MQLASSIRDFFDATMADKVGVFLASWQQLSGDDRKKAIAAFTKQPKVQATLKEPKTSTCPSTVYSGIQLSSYYSYLYYYPTMHWTLDRTPEDDTYWVGFFKTDAKDTDYIHESVESCFCSVA